MKNLYILCENEKIIKIHSDDYTFMCIDVKLWPDSNLVKFFFARKLFSF